jgi:hypothetical protein
VLFEEVKDFFTAFLVFSNQMNDLNAQLAEIKEKMLSELKSQGIDLG